LLPSTAESKQLEIVATSITWQEVWCARTNLTNNVKEKGCFV
jgi:hypothetical protein